MSVAFLAQQAAAGCLQVATLPLMLVAVFYLLVWRPQQKQAEDAKKFRDGLKSDDQVITAGGILGKIVEVDAESVKLEVSRGVRIRVLRSQIVKLQESPASADDDGVEKSKK